MPFHFNVERKQSSIAGAGLFTAEKIRKDQVIWDFSDKGNQYKRCGEIEPISNIFVPKEELLAMDEAQQRHIVYGGFYFQPMEGWAYLVDGGQFVNHQDEPNTLTVFPQNGNIYDVHTIALRDIEADEELTENYLSLESSPGWAHDLMCRVVPEQKTLDLEIIARLQRKAK